MYVINVYVMRLQLTTIERPHQIYSRTETIKMTKKRISVIYQWHSPISLFHGSLNDGEGNPTKGIDPIDLSFTTIWPLFTITLSHTAASASHFEGNNCNVLLIRFSFFQKKN